MMPPLTEGAYAHKSGEPVGANPYGLATPEGRMWMRGWTDRAIKSMDPREVRRNTDAGIAAAREAGTIPTRSEATRRADALYAEVVDARRTESTPVTYMLRLTGEDACGRHVRGADHDHFCQLPLNHSPLTCMCHCGTYLT